MKEALMQLPEMYRCIGLYFWHFAICDTKRG